MNIVMGSEENLSKAVYTGGSAWKVSADVHSIKAPGNMGERSESQVIGLPRTCSDDKRNSVCSQNCEKSVQNLVNVHPRYFPNVTESLPIFDPVDGDVDIVQFIDKMEECGYLYNWDDTAIIHFTLSRLKGNASCWRDSLPRDERSWDDWKELLVDNFPVIRSSIQNVLEAQNYKRTGGQNIVDYFYKKLALCNKARLKADELVEWIVMGLDNNRFQDYLGPLSRYQTPASLLTELVNAARYIDRSSNYTSHKNVKIESKSSRNVTCFKCREKGHLSNQCPNKRKIACFVCNQEGHMAKECSTRSNARNTPIASTSNRINKNGGSRNQVIHAESSNSHAKYFKTGQLNGLDIKCYIDMGSSVTLIRQSNAEQLKIKWCETKGGNSVIGYGAGVVVPIGSFIGKLTIDGVSVEVRILVVPDSSQSVPLLVGHQFTEQENVRIISDSNGLTIESGNDHTEYTSPNKYALVSTEVSVIPDNYIGYMNVHANISNKELCVEGRMQATGEVIPRCLIRLDHDGNSILPVLNMTGDNMMVDKNQTIARGEICLPSTKQVTKSNEGHPVINKEEVNTELCGEEVEQLMELLNQHRKAIAFNVSQIGKTSSAEMDIVLKDDIPIYFRPYRLAQSERDKVKDLVEELKEADIIEDSVSPYASPIILVKKRNGDIRMCIDYRQLNSKTVRDHFPLPLIDDQLDRLQGKVYFTSLDLASGYYQVPVAENSKHKTAFVTPDGHYQFKRMPFGLCNAPAVFQRLINKVLGRFRYTIAMAYLDDIIIPSATVAEGLDNLKTILELIENSGLTLNLHKCVFFKKNIEYLGFEISCVGIEPSKRKLASVENFPVPTCVRDVRSFVGLCSYFRRFIKGFATIARPLTELLKEDVKFSWNEEQIHAFQEIKGILLSKPILAIYNPNSKCEVHTDASAVGLGAVLYQEQEGNCLKPVMYYSRKTSREEAKYSAIELEALAIVTALEKFRVYLLGKHFVVRTDCNSLKMLANKQGMVPRISRWFLRVSEFDFAVEYMPGKSNQVADALSRYPVHEVDDGVNENMVCLGININTDWVAAMQRIDPEILNIRNRLEDGDQEAHKKYSIYNCRVYKYTKYRWRLYVPECLRYDVVRDAHESVAHYGIDKTLAKLKQSYYFPKMKEVVNRYINRCINCMYYKLQSGKKPGFLHPLEKGSKPFVTVHMDHIGPYVATKSRNRYVAVLVDGYSKYVVLGAQTDVSTEKTLTVFKQFISNYGRPEKLITDQGTAFKSKAFQEFCEKHFIQQVMVASGCPRANGQVERINRVVTEKLAMVSTGIECEDWDEKLYEVQMAINNSVNKVTKRTPAELVFQHTFRSTKDSPLTDEIEKVNEELQIETEDIDVPDLLERNRETQRRQFNKHRRKPAILEPGELVLLQSEPPAYGDSRKLLGKYKGPYEVLKCIGNDRYLIGDIEGEKQSQRIYRAIVAIDRLKRVNPT